MDLRQLESEVQRLVGYQCVVTSGVADRGPHMDFNATQRLLRVWIPRSGAEAARIAELARASLEKDAEPAYQEIEY